MVNNQAIRAIKPTPGQAAAIAVFADLYSKNPAVIKNLLNKHEQTFTGNPTLDLLQTAELIKNRGRFFNTDFEKTWNDAKYFSLSDFGDKLKEVGQNIMQTVAPIAGQAVQLFAPAIGQAAAGLIGGGGGEGGGGAAGGDGSGAGLAGFMSGGDSGGGLSGFLSGGGGASVISGLTGSIGQLLSNLKKKKEDIQPVASEVISEPVKQAIAQTFSESSTGNLDSRPSAADILALLNGGSSPASTEKKILGMTKKTFIIVACIVGAVIVAIVIWVIIHYRKKAKLKAKKD